MSLTLSHWFQEVEPLFPSSWIWKDHIMALISSTWWFNAAAALGVAIPWPGGFYILTWKPATKHNCQEKLKFGREALENEMQTGERERPRRHQVCEWGSCLGCLLGWGFILHQLQLQWLGAAWESSKLNHPADRSQLIGPWEMLHCFKPLHFDIVSYEAISNQNRICYQRQTLRFLKVILSEEC